MKKVKRNPHTNPLQNHRVTPEYRTKMLDWLVEVTSAFGCQERTYFLATSMFDNYLRASKDLENKDVHLIGITSLFLASKYEDLRPLSAELISDKISHSAFSKKDILNKHTEMLMVFEFDLSFATHYDLFMSLTVK